MPELQIVTTTRGQHLYLETMLSWQMSLLLT